MGKVSTRKRGKTWQYYFQLASVNETRKWKTGSGYRTKAEAQAAGTKALAEYNSTGIAFKVSEQSVADYFDYWMEHILYFLYGILDKIYNLYNFLAYQSLILICSSYPSCNNSGWSNTLPLTEFFVLIP